MRNLPTLTITMLRETESALSASTSLAHILAIEDSDAAITLAWAPNAYTSTDLAWFRSPLNGAS